MQDTVSYTVHSFLLTRRGEQEYNMSKMLFRVYKIMFIAVVFTMKYCYDKFHCVILVSGEIFKVNFNLKMDVPI